MVTTLYATIATKTKSKGIIATFDPFKNDLTDGRSVSELKISFEAKKIIKETTAIILYAITWAVVTVVVVVVTVDIMNNSSFIHVIYNFVF